MNVINKVLNSLTWYFFSLENIVLILSLSKYGVSASKLLDWGSCVSNITYVPLIIVFRNSLKPNALIMLTAFEWEGIAIVTRLPWHWDLI